MNQLYKNIGISKQAVAQYKKRQDLFDDSMMQLMLEVQELRQEHPGCGLEKIYFTLNPDFIGRDRFIEYFSELGFKIKKKINYKRTTYSTASKFPNLIKGIAIKSPSHSLTAK